MGAADSLEEMGMGNHYSLHNDNTSTCSGSSSSTLIFTYGTLKHGFSNHTLLQDMMASGDAAFLGLCRTANQLPLVCGPYRVPFLLNFHGRGHPVSGELYSVSPRALARMDDLEGVTRGHYDRLPIRVVLIHEEEEEEEEEDHDPLPIEAEAYYAHSTYAEALWKRNGEKGYHCYSEKEAKGYVKRKDRPQHLSFLDQIQLFLSSPSPPPPDLHPIAAAGVATTASK
ncbi:putative gamma-glutamylcyclotransferase At3g02910 [Coffea eugenioides]|uniref:putative gamma-glutamylcyclotransferase At3g02910 n=1 Tax=Coffea eugenioides TaxID=49369 RepID=UPI000F60DD81|nr:putative gamma-glutamylcyclotransferase At3g02910 [Coffea eugenioides]